MTGGLTQDTTLQLVPGSYEIDSFYATYGKFTVSDQGTISGTTGALLGTWNTVGFDLSKLANVTIAGGQPGGILAIANLSGGISTDYTIYLPPATYTVANNFGTFGTFTVSAGLTVSGTTGDLIASSNTVGFDLSKLAKVTIAGGQPGGILAIANLSGGG